jgi:hypothetical protein
MISLTSPRGRRALELRQQAIAVVQKHGSWEPVGTMRWLSAKLGNLDISYRTPFQPVPRVPEAMRVYRARDGRCADFGYGIDVWWQHKKVLGIVWNDPKPIEIFNFHRGEWEHEMAKLAGDLV